MPMRQPWLPGERRKHARDHAELRRASRRSSRSYGRPGQGQNASTIRTNTRPRPSTGPGRAPGLAISTLLNLVNPEKLVLYGPAELVGESEYASARRFMKHVRQSAKKYAFSTADGDCSVIPKAYDYETGAQAVATVALLRARRLDRALAMR